jgi:selenide,water dikinase
MIDTTTKLNTPGIALADLPGVHAMTDVTGFGLLGHLLEICRGSRLRAEVRYADIPVIAEAADLAARGYATGASDRNWSSYAGDTILPAAMPAWQRKMLTDPQTSGGLLVACDPDTVPEVMKAFERDGFEAARLIGRLTPGAAGVAVS